MQVNFKKINVKFLIISLSLILLGGTNSNLKAMEKNNILAAHNNINNNMSTLEKQVDFSDFKNFVEKLSEYNYSPDKGTQQDCYEECVAFISLLPSFILKDTSNMNFNTRSIDFMQALQKNLTKILENKTSNEPANSSIMIRIVKDIINNACSQFGIKMFCLNTIDKDNWRDTISNIIDDFKDNSQLENYIESCSNEICLNYLLDYSSFNCFFKSDGDSRYAYDSFLKILKKYSINWTKEQYTKILNIMISNCFNYIVKADFHFTEILTHPLDSKFSVQLFDDLVDDQKSFFTKSKTIGDNSLYNYLYNEIIPFLIEQLATIEYNSNENAYINNKAMSVSIISNKITKESIVPYIKKYMLDLYNKLSEFCQQNINEQNAIIKNLENSKSEKDKKKVQTAQNIMKKYYESYNMINVLKESLNNLLLKDELVMKQFQNTLNINNIVHKATKELRREPVLNTFLKKQVFVNGNNEHKKIKSKYIVENINSFLGTNTQANAPITKLMAHTHNVNQD